MLWSSAWCTFAGLGALYYALRAQVPDCPRQPLTQQFGQSEAPVKGRLLSLNEPCYATDLSLAGNNHDALADWQLDKPPGVDSTGHLIFETVNSLLQHWPNTRMRNGGVSLRHSSSVTSLTRVHDERQVTTSCQGQSLQGHSYTVGHGAPASLVGPAGQRPTQSTRFYSVGRWSKRMDVGTLPSCRRGPSKLCISMAAVPPRLHSRRWIARTSLRGELCSRVGHLQKGTGSKTCVSGVGNIASMGL